MNHTAHAELICQNEIATATKHLEFLHTHRATLNFLNLRLSLWSDRLDFDNLERPDLLRVLKAFPGTWIKEPTFSSAGINYILEEKVSGFTIRCYNGQPPPSCRIEETTEFVLVPERLEKKVVRKIICPPTPI